MDAVFKALFAAMRSSEFWALVAQVVIENLHAPVPEEFKAIGWAYIALRVVGKLAKYVFPNPANSQGGFFKAD